LGFRLFRRKLTGLVLYIIIKTGLELEVEAAESETGAEVEQEEQEMALQNGELLETAKSPTLAQRCSCEEASEQRSANLFWVPALACVEPGRERDGRKVTSAAEGMSAQRLRCGEGKF